MVSDERHDIAADARPQNEEAEDELRAAPWRGGRA